MVSCENLLAESTELFGAGLESSTLKGTKGRSKIYRSGAGIFSNPFKSDTEKMEQLSELLRQYKESGIPDPKQLPLARIAAQQQSQPKFNHLRASSLSISGILSSANPPTSPCGIAPPGANSSIGSGLLSATRTSLSTTDLHHLNQSQQQNAAALAALPFVSTLSCDPTLDSFYELEPEWRSIVADADQLPARVQSQNEAIWELLQTEAFYIRRLKVINDLFISCLLNLQNECLLTEIDAKSVFGNIGEVYEANHQFWMRHLLPMLNYSRETRQPLNPAMFEDGFLQFDNIFRPYIQYCLEHSACLQYLKEKRKSNVLFKTYILWCENHKDCERLRLMDLLVKPMQRLTKYSLLLKAILKKTDDELHREALKRMDICVDRFVAGVNGTMYRQQEQERLSALAARIDAYDAIDCNNDEAEKMIREHLSLDLMQSMPGCATHKIRHLYLEDSLKLKDAQSNKIDVQCILFTDVFLVCKAANKKNADMSRIKIIRQPFITDRLVVRELKDNSGFVAVYLNELQVAVSFLILYTPDARTWVETIRKAQDDFRALKYSSEQEFQTYQASFYDDEPFDQAAAVAAGLLVEGPSSARSSSRSSLIHSHSGSQDLNEQYIPNQYSSTNQLMPSQPPRAVSFELGDLRNPSLIVEDADSFGRSNSVDNRAPVAVTVTSPRPERRAFLLRNSPGPRSNGVAGPVCTLHVSQTHTQPIIQATPASQPPLVVVPQPMPRVSRKTGAQVALEYSPTVSPVTSQQSSPSHQMHHHHSVHHSTPIQVAVHPPPPSTPQGVNGVSRQQTPSPPSLMSITSKSPSSMTMTVNKPPLVKTKNVSCGVASLSSLPSEQSDESQPESLYLKNPQAISKRNCRPDRRYHTADSIEHMKKEKDASIHKRLSWNYGNQPTPSCCSHIHGSSGGAQNLLHPRQSCACCASHESVYSSSGFSSTGSVPLSVGSATEQTDSNGCVCCGASSTSGLPSFEMRQYPFEEEEEDDTRSADFTVLGATPPHSTAATTTGSGTIHCDAYSHDRDSALPVSPAGLPTLSASPIEHHPPHHHHHHCYSASIDSNCSADGVYGTNSHGSLNSTSGPLSYGSSHGGSGNYSTPSVVNPADIKIDVSEPKDGISSVQITLTGNNTVTRPSKADLKKMKDFLLNNCNADATEV